MCSNFLIIETQSLKRFFSIEAVNNILVAGPLSRFGELLILYVAKELDLGPFSPRPSIMGYLLQSFCKPLTVS